MTPEAPQLSPIPEEIIVPETVLQTNSDGKKYEYEKDGRYYGGDYIQEPPTEIHLDDLPPPPKELPPIV